MPLPESTVLLPIDRATVCLPPINPREIVTKHRDGELMKLTRPWHYSTCELRRRDEADATWTHTSTLTVVEGITAMATMQGFGIRYNGDPVRPDTLTDLYPEDTVELELLDNGGVVIESNTQLPITLHRRDNTLWRLRELQDRTGDPEATSSGTLVEYAYVIEQADSTTPQPDREWERITGLYPDHSAGDAAVEFAGRVGIPYVDTPITSERIDNTLSQLVYCFEDITGEETDLSYREELGIPTQTVMFTEDITESLFPSPYK